MWNHIHFEIFCKAMGKLGNILFPINVPLFAHLRKHCCGNKMCFPGSKNVSQEIQKHFCCGNNVSWFAHMFQVFRARETLFLD